MINTKYSTFTFTGNTTNFTWNDPHFLNKINFQQLDNLYMKYDSTKSYFYNTTGITLNYISNYNTIKIYGDIFIVNNISGGTYNFVSGVEHLKIDNSNLSILLTLPIHLKSLDVSNNNLTTITIPTQLQYLNVSNNPLTTLPTLPTNLTYLSCSGVSFSTSTIDQILNNLISNNKNNGTVIFSTIYSGLTHTILLNRGWTINIPIITTLDYCNIGLSSLLYSPNGTINLYCSGNTLTSINLNSSLEVLKCGYNQITDLILPTGLTYLECNNNLLTSLTLPSGLTYLNCSGNSITSLNIPTNLVYLNCNGNSFSQITIDRILNDLVTNNKNNGYVNLVGTNYLSQNSYFTRKTLIDRGWTVDVNGNPSLDFSSNNLSVLPYLNEGILNLSFSGNPMTTLPVFPNSLQYLNCRNCNLSYSSLEDLIIYLTNPVNCSNLNYLDITGQEPHIVLSASTIRDFKTVRTGITFFELSTVGMVLYLDSDNPKSYISGTTEWYDLVSGINFLDSGSTFSVSGNNTFYTNGIDQMVRTKWSELTDLNTRYNGMTITMMIKPDNYTIPFSKHRQIQLNYTSGNTYELSVAGSNCGISRGAFLDSNDNIYSFNYPSNNSQSTYLYNKDFKLLNSMLYTGTYNVYNYLLYDNTIYGVAYSYLYYTPQSVYTTTAITFSYTSYGATFSPAWDITADSTKLYIAGTNSSGSQLFRINRLSYGAIELTYGTLGTGDAQFNFGTYNYGGITCDDTYVYVADTGNHRIKKHLKSDFSFVSKFGTNGTDDATQFNQPTSIEYNNGLLYVADYGNNKIKVFNTNLVYQYYISNNEMISPTHVSVNDNYILVSQNPNYNYAPQKLLLKKSDFSIYSKKYEYSLTLNPCVGYYGFRCVYSDGSNLITYDRGGYRRIITTGTTKVSSSYVSGVPDPSNMIKYGSDYYFASEAGLYKTNSGFTVTNSADTSIYFYGIDMDNTYFYLSRGTTEIRKYLKSNMTYSGSTTAPSVAYGLRIDGSEMFLVTNSSTIRVINKDTFAFLRDYSVAANASYGIRIIGDDLYILSSSNIMYVLDKTTGVIKNSYNLMNKFLKLSNPINFDILGDYVYVSNNYILTLYKFSDFSYVSEQGTLSKCLLSPVITGWTQVDIVITIDRMYLYVNGQYCDDDYIGDMKFDNTIGYTFGEKCDVFSSVGVRLLSVHNRTKSAIEISNSYNTLKNEM